MRKRTQGRTARNAQSLDARRRGTDVSTAPPQRSLDRPAQERARAVDGEPGQADRDHEGPVDKHERLGAL
eukprot:3488472-Alexandrium_andersonii.AAC.1